MRVLVDTNVLLRSAQPSHVLCQRATQAVSRLIREDAGVFFCSQTIAEFWNVATRPTALNGLGFSHDAVLREIDDIENLLTLLPDVPRSTPFGNSLSGTTASRASRSMMPA
jgi:predicted nucleic acid-binding protein